MDLVPNHELIWARVALGEARKMRAAALDDVAQGERTIIEIIGMACEADGAPLLQLELRELLMSQPSRHTRPEAEGFLRKVAALLETNDDLTNARVRWLVDPRAGGRRLRAWIDVAQPRHQPWQGFPHL